MTKKFTSDPINSTYRWVFHFTPGMGNVPTMDGYSKGIGAENTNDRVLLMKKLQNPLLTKFKNCDMIEVFRNEFGIPKGQHSRVLILYPHKFELFGEFQADPFLQKYLNAFYTEFLETGRTEAPEPPVMPVSKEVLRGELSHTVRFRNHDELLTFVQRNTHKFGDGFMKAWYWKHLEIQPEIKTTGKRVDYSRGREHVNTF